jgi:Ser/Thr protein kinase RdoA (MazF antagonist)
MSIASNIREKYFCRDELSTLFRAVTVSRVPAGPDTDLFLDLTPDRVLDAAEAGGLNPTGLCYPLNSFENRVYEVGLEGDTRVIAKFYRPHRWNREQILEEHTLLAALERAEVPVANVRPFPDGETLKEIEGIYYSLSDRRGGRAPDELDAGSARRLGMLIGRLHNVASGVEVRRRPRLDADRYVRAALKWIAAEGSLHGVLEERYTRAALALAEIADRALDGVEIQPVHADLHLGNILLRDQELRLLDFDDMAIGPPVQDLWLAVPGRDEESQRLRASLVAGYEQFRVFDHSSLSLIEPLRGLRMVRYAGWLARRWHDPAFRAAWPHFGSEEYWRQEAEDLEEQVATLQRAGDVVAGVLQPAAEATEPVPELTNKDYFWDWEGK